MYGYEIWYDHCFVGSDDGFDTEEEEEEEEAVEEARAAITEKLKDWESDGAEVDWDKDPDYFEIRIEGGVENG